MQSSAFRPLLAFAFLALALAACNGDGEKARPVLQQSPEPEVRTVTSDDGKLTLEIPFGAVGDDVQITATAVPQAELPDELARLRGAGTGYRLEPEGLEFSEPVDVALTLDVAELEGQPENGTSAFGLVTFDETSGRQILDGLLTAASPTEGTTTARAKLTHFSLLGRTQGSLSVGLGEVPLQQAAEADFQPEVAWTNTDPSGSVTLQDVFVQYRSSGSVRVAGDVILSGMNLSPGDEVAGGARFQCTSFDGPGTYGVSVHATSVVEVDGEPIETELRLVLERPVQCGEAAPGS